MANEGAHLYDAAKDAIQLNYDFDNAAVEQLFNMFNDTTPKLLSLYEKREFLTYFFLGTHAIPELTPKQAWDFKTTFDIRNFPANGIPAYLPWLNANGNNYINAFPYPFIDGNGRIRQNKWNIGFIDDIIKDFTDLVNNQNNYNNWLSDIQKGMGSWQQATDKLSSATNIKHFFAKIAGLFATGKFIKYYEDYVKPDLQKVATGRTKFDPYTGNITINHPDDSYTIPFSKLTTKTDDYANKLMNKGYIKDQTLSYQHRLFCLLCQWLANSFESYVLDDIDPEVAKNIKTFWDFTPSLEEGSLPRDPGTERPKILVNTNLIQYIMYAGGMFLEEILKINDGNTSYKELWDGAKMKLSSGKEIDCPFYYVIHVDFDSVSPEDNPFAGKALTRMNEMIAEIMRYRDELSDKIQSIMKNVTNLKTCGTSVTNLSTTIFEEGSTDNQVIINASCTMDSNGETKSESNESVTNKENEIDTSSVQTAFRLNRPEKNKEETPEEKPQEELPKEENDQEKTSNKTLIIIIVAIVAVILIVGIGIWVYKSRKNNSVKKDEEEPLIP